jgi:hypothetical protein
MKNFLFTITLQAPAETVEQAWENAIDAFSIAPGPYPDDYIEEAEADEDESPATQTNVAANRAQAFLADHKLKSALRQLRDQVRHRLPDYMSFPYATICDAANVMAAAELEALIKAEQAFAQAKIAELNAIVRSNAKDSN